MELRINRVQINHSRPVVPIEKWEKLGLKEPVKEVSVKTVPLKDQSFQKKAISQVKNQQGQGKQK